MVTAVPAARSLSDGSWEERRPQAQGSKASLGALLYFKTGCVRVGRVEGGVGVAFPGSLFLISHEA